MTNKENGDKTLLIGGVGYNDIQQEQELTNAHLFLGNILDFIPTTVNIDSDINYFDNITQKIQYDLRADLDFQNSKQTPIKRAIQEITAPNYNKIQLGNIAQQPSNISKLTQKRSSMPDFSNKNQNEPLFKKKQKKIINQDINNQIKMQSRADIIYGDDKQYFKKYSKQKPNIETKQYEPITLDIANVEQTLFPNGLLSEQPMRQDFADINQSHFQKKANNKNNLFLNDVNLIYNLGLTGLEILKKDIDVDNNSQLSFLLHLLSSNFQIGIIYLAFLIYQNRGLLAKYNSIGKFLDNIEPDKLEIFLQQYINGGKLSQFLAELFIGYDAANLLKLSGKNANLRSNYTKKATIYESVNNLPERYKKTIQEKIKDQKLNPKHTKGIIFSPDSKLSRNIVKNKKFRKIIFNNIEKIKNQDKNSSFSTSIEFLDKNLYYAIHYADLKNISESKSFMIIGDLIDTTDYNEDDKKPLVQAAKRLQDKKEIEPKFIIVQFVITQKDL